MGIFQEKIGLLSRKFSNSLDCTHFSTKKLNYGMIQGHTAAFEKFKPLNYKLFGI